MGKQDVIAEALQLTEAERLELAEAMYESLAGPPELALKQAGERKLLDA